MTNKQYKSFKEKCIVIDHLGFEHPTSLPKEIFYDDIVTARVTGYRYIAPGNTSDGPQAFLLLENIKLDTEKSYRDGKKSPEQWAEEVGDLPKHVCGKVAVCNCCNKTFISGKGIRVDGTDIYFCNDCKKKFLGDRKRMERTCHFYSNVE